MRAGVPIADLAHEMGHTSVARTFTTYARSPSSSAHTPYSAARFVGFSGTLVSGDRSPDSLRR
jgi:hypothetical protein